MAIVLRPDSETEEYGLTTYEGKKVKELTAYARRKGQLPRMPRGKYAYEAALYGNWREEGWRGAVLAGFLEQGGLFDIRSTKEKTKIRRRR